MASVFSKSGSKGETYWYASIYLNGAPKQFVLFEPDGRTRPVDQARALALAGTLERKLKQQPAVQAGVNRKSRFTTVWPLFVASYVSGLAENTRNDYHWAYEGHFRTAPFATKRVSLITHTDILAYVGSKKRGKGALSPHTLNNQTAMLSRFFEWAGQNGYWSGAINPAKAMGVRQKQTPNPKVYLQEPEHSLLLVHYFDKPEDAKHRLLTATLLWAGLRWSEARSLLWSQVILGNPKHQHLRIQTTAVGNTIQSHGKTPSSDRRVGVCPTLARMFQDWEQRRNTPDGWTSPQEKARLGIDAADGLVFPSDSGTLLSPGNFRRRQFKNAKTAAHKLDPSFPLGLEVHGCRHSSAMALLSNGLTHYEVGFELGHSKGSLGSTGAYTHANARKLNPKAAAALERSIQEGYAALSAKNLMVSGAAIVAIPAPAPRPKAPAPPRASKPKPKLVGPAKRVAGRGGATP